VGRLRERSASDGGGHEAKDGTAAGGLGLRRCPDGEPAGASAGWAWEAHALR
jgi:hypothetical protein